MHSYPFSIFIWLVLISNFASAQSQTPPLVNLARLSSTAVYGGIVSGDESPDNKFFGLLNAFDDGSNVINDVLYDTWSAKGNNTWARFRFDRPIALQAFVIDINDQFVAEGYELPETYNVYTRKIGATSFVAHPMEKLSFGENRNRLPETVKGVTEVIFTAIDSDYLYIREIQLMGYAQPGADLTPQLPRLDRTIPIDFVPAIRENERLRAIEMRRMSPTASLEIVDNEAHVYRSGQQLLSIPLKPRREYGEPNYRFFEADEVHLYDWMLAVNRNVMGRIGTDLNPNADSLELYYLSGRKEVISDREIVYPFTSGVSFESPTGEWAVLAIVEEGMLYGYLLITSDGTMINKDLVSINENPRVHKWLEIEDSGFDDEDILKLVIKYHKRPTTKEVHITRAGEYVVVTKEN